METESQEVFTALPYYTEWSTGLFDCLGYRATECCWFCFCSCIQFGENAQTIQPEEPCLKLKCCFAYVLGRILCVPAGLLGSFYRDMLRQRYGILGTVFTDCIVHTLFYPCAIAQETQEIEARGRDFSSEESTDGSYRNSIIVPTPPMERYGSTNSQQALLH